MNAEAAALLARFDVKVDVREPLERFSTAIQQMVAIARAVSFDARAGHHGRANIFAG